MKRFDRSRKYKKVSNEDWESPTDADSRITRMKDGTTHLAYKAEHAVDLDSGLIVAAEIYHGTAADTRTLEDTVHLAQEHLQASGSDVGVRDVVADKGYYSAHVVSDLGEHTTCRTYIAEPELAAGQQRRWTDKPAGQREAVSANRRRGRGQRGRRLQRQRSERVERTFAHVCETGGARRTWLRGIEKVRKRYLLAAAAHNLGCLMRELFGIGTPRSLQGAARMTAALFAALRYLQIACVTTLQRGEAVLTCHHKMTTHFKPPRLNHSCC